MKYGELKSVIIQNSALPFHKISYIPQIFAQNYRGE